MRTSTFPPTRSHTPSGNTAVIADAYQRRWWTLAVLTLAGFMVGIDATVLNVALPSLVRELGASTSQLQWITTAYSLVFAGLLLTAGSLGDRFGRKRALMLGLVIFGLGSALCAYSPSAIVLIAARGLLGLGAAFVFPATLSVLTNVFPDAERPKAIGIAAAAGALAPAVGPTLGGWLLGQFWWGSIFLINVPLAAIALLAAWAIVPASKDPSAPRPDPSRCRAVDRGPGRAAVCDHRGAGQGLAQPGHRGRVGWRRSAAGWLRLLGGPQHPPHA